MLGSLEFNSMSLFAMEPTAVAIETGDFEL